MLTSMPPAHVVLMTLYVAFEAVVMASDHG